MQNESCPEHEEVIRCMCGEELLFCVQNSPMDDEASLDNYVAGE